LDLESLVVLPALKTKCCSIVLPFSTGHVSRYALFCGKVPSPQRLVLGAPDADSKCAMKAKHKCRLCQLASWS
jgi:hypothetical protein